MSKHDHSAEEKLRTLGQRLQQGWAKLHPVTDQEMAAVNEALEKQWEQTHQADATKSQTEASPPTTSLPSQSQQEQKPDKARAQDSESQDHDHEQSQ